MSEHKLTPLQTAIQFWTERYKEAKEAGALKTMEAAELFLLYLEVLLPSEQKLLSDTWDAATTTCIESGGPADYFLYTKESYLNQFKP